ncbi:MAG TPA: pilus assembly PilX N-terminal domain-containing protein [Pyrinomonadaceae bacterium]|jgi:hypothetical protein
MKKTLKPNVAPERCRRRERGAALVTVLLTSMLLLAAGGALIMTTSMSASSAYDSTGEMQAYSAAEAGLQEALNVLRGNVAPNPLFTPNPALPVGSVADENKMSFRRAMMRDTSNLTTDPLTFADGTSVPVRLSRWLTYNYPTAGTPTRVVLGDPATYTPITGMAYSVSVEDPDNSASITYSTTGLFTYTGTGSAVVSNTSTSTSVTFPTATASNRITITYSNRPSTTITAYPTVNGNLGSFTITKVGTGLVNVPSGINFRLRVSQTVPQSGYVDYFATMPDTGLITSAASTAELIFKYESGTISETRYLLTLAALTKSLTLVYPGGAGVTPLQASITAADPRRLIIRSTGYGPGNSEKHLAMTVSRYRFELEPPAPIVIRGADPVGGATPLPMTFDLGSSNAKKYSGKDLGGIDAPKASVAINLYDWHAAYEGIIKGSTVAEPKLSILDLNTIPTPWPNPAHAQLQPIPGPSPSPAIPDSAITPDFLRTADDTRTFLMEMEAIARDTDVTAAAPNGRYFTSLTGMAGDDDPYTPKFTFVDGNCHLDGGAGLLIVTGNLDLAGNADFQGVILVLGNGYVTRSGGGSGIIKGSWLVARFLRNPTAGQNRNFLQPHFDVSGGGNSEFHFDSRTIRDANNLMGGRVLGVVEY